MLARSSSIRWLVALATAGCWLATCTPTGAAATGTASAAGAAASSRQPRALDCRTLRPVPTDALRAGRCVLVEAAGFDRHETVRIAELHRPGWSATARADAAGRLRYRLLNGPSGPAGADVLTLVGLGSPNTDPGAGNVTVAVPRFAVFRFTVRRSGR